MTSPSPGTEKEIQGQIRDELCHDWEKQFTAMYGRRQTASSHSERSSDETSSSRSARSVQGKMILPRLEEPFHETIPLPKRTAHACERCRALKAKCTAGERCEKCIFDKADCRYGDGKRERNKKCDTIIS